MGQMASKRAKKAERGELGEYLREQRQILGLTLRETALRTGEEGLSRSYLSQVETGKIRRPSPETLSLLVTAYQADYGELLRKAGYGGVSPEQGPSWLPADTSQLDPEEQRTAAQYIEYLLWRRSPPEYPEEEDPQGRWISWGEVQEWALELKAKLDRRGFDPDLVIGLGRGGAILGGMVAGALGLKRVGVLDMVHSPGAPEDERRIEGSLDLTDVHRALLVQGEVRSGKSLEKARERLREEKRELELWTIALVVYPGVQLDQRPDEYKRLAKLDPPWRRVPGYVRDLRKKQSGGS